MTRARGTDVRLQRLPSPADTHLGLAGRLGLELHLPLVNLGALGLLRTLEKKVWWRRA